MTGVGAARGVWESAAHPRGRGGKFARKTVDVTERRNTGVRSPQAFQPPIPAGQRRSQVQEVRAAVGLFNRDPRTLSAQERWRTEWASPKRQAMQQALTGDIRIPRREGMKREALAAGRHAMSPIGRKGGHRDLIAYNPRTGKVEARRGTRDVILADGHVKAAKRARRLFDLAPKPKPAKGAAKPAAPAYQASDFAVWTDAKIRDLAGSLGIQHAPRAGRNQLIKLILERP